MLSVSVAKLPTYIAHFGEGGTPKICSVISISNLQDTDGAASDVDRSLAKCSSQKVESDSNAYVAVC